MNKTIIYAMAHAKNNPLNHMTFFRAEVEKSNGRTNYWLLTFYGERSVRYNSVSQLILDTIELYGNWVGFTTIPFELEG